jgi:hypothetical protein
MSFQGKMIDVATGASPPSIRTHDAGCSPIHFELSNKSTSESGRNVDCLTILPSQEKQKIKENVAMKKYVLFVSFNLAKRFSKKLSNNTVFYLMISLNKRSFEKLQPNFCLRQQIIPLKITHVALSNLSKLLIGTD